MKIKTFFETHPVFRYEEFVTYLQAMGITKLATCRQQLAYHHKVGNIIHIRRSLYAVKPSSTKQEDFWIDPYLIAGKASNDAVIAYHTALELHELAYTSFEELIYLSQHKIVQPFTYQGQRFRSVSFQRSLVAQDSAHQHLVELKRQGVIIRVTNLERTIVDILDRPNLGGGWEEIWRSLDHVTHFNTEKLVQYVLSLANATTIAKVGFFLTNLPNHLAVESTYIEKLLPHIPKQPHYMDPQKHGEGRYIKQWQLIVPLEIIERRFEEPQNDI